MTKKFKTRKGIGVWFADVFMGFRFAVAGGRSGWIRAGLTALGVALAVAVLLVAASIPSVVASQTERQISQAYVQPKKGDTGDTILIEDRYSKFRDVTIRGMAVQAQGAEAPVPPGIDEIPEPGEMYVSPALAELLSSKDGELLKPRFDARVAGTIGEAGLTGPGELEFYLGSDKLDKDIATPVAKFGTNEQPDNGPVDPTLLLLVLVAVTIMLLPVFMFMAVAVRFGGERRDRRLAALRLVGADQAMTRRVAAGESLLGALVGLAFGWALFEVGVRLLIGAGLLEYITSGEITVYAGDVDPDPMYTTIVVLAVPLVSIFATQLSMRRLAVEPLGVVRNAKPTRRRLWWRLALVVLGVGALLEPMVSGILGPDLERIVTVFGVLTMLLGLAAILPWVVETVVARMRGGAPSWQLATRRLQLGGGSAFRAVIGVAVAAAGAIALQMLFSAIESDELNYTGADPNQTEVSAAAARTDLDGVTGKLNEVDGAEVVESYSMLEGGSDDYELSMLIADCEELSRISDIDDCSKGDVFTVPASEGVPKPGTEVEMYNMDASGGSSGKLTIPEADGEAKLKSDEDFTGWVNMLVTPEAIEKSMLKNAWHTVVVETDPSMPDAVEQVRNVAASQTPQWEAHTFTGVEMSDTFAKLRSALLAGVVGTMLLIGLSLLVNTIEQLQERRRLMSVLVAFGTRRRSLVFSVLWQTAIPVVLGLIAATVTGIGLGSMLVSLTSYKVSVDWSGVLMFNAAGAVMVLIVTLLSFPPLWRMMRPDGIRTE